MAYDRDDELNQRRLDAINGSPDDSQPRDDSSARDSDEEDDFSPKDDVVSKEERDALGLDKEDDIDYRPEEPDYDYPAFDYSPDKERGALAIKKLFGKRASTGLITIALAIGTGLGLTTLLAPLKLVGIMKTIDERYFAANNSALDEGTQRLVSKYIQNRVIPALSKPGCSSRKITKDCVATVSPDSSPIGKIFSRMSEAKYEERLAESGLEFRRVNKRLVMLVDKPDSDSLRAELNDPKSWTKGVYEIGTSGSSGIQTLYDHKGNPIDTLQNSFSSRKEIRSMLRAKIKETGKHDKLWHYYKISGFAEKKYGLKKCFVACNLRDDYADWKQDFKENNQHLNYRKRALVGVSSRVIGKVDAGYGFLIQCLITSACDENTLSDDPKDRDKQTFFERKMSEEARRLAARGEKELVQEALKKFEDITNAGSVKQYLLEKVLTKFLEEKLAEEVAKRAIPVLGWVDMFNTIAKKMAALPKIYSGLRYSIMTAGAISSYMTLRTHADEITTGDTQGELSQAAIGLLGEDNPSDDPSLNAEKSRVFQDVMSSAPLQVVGLFGTSYAQSTTTTAYPCDDNGNYIQPDETTCPNERFDLTNSKVESIGKIGKGLYDITEPYDKSIGKLSTFTGNLVSKTAEPLVKVLTAPIQGQIDDITKAASDKLQKTIQEGNLLDTPFTDKINGPQLINAAIAGAEVLGNQAASEQLGLPEDKDGRVTVGLWETNKNLETEQFLKKSLYARVFDKNDRLSLVSQMYLSRPASNSSGVVAKLAALIRQTPSIATTTTQTIVMSTSGRGMAAEPVKYTSPFGMTTYALAPNSPVYDEIIEHGGYTDEECKQMDEEWYASARIDDKTRQTVYQSVNKCRLWKAMAIGTVGYFTQSPNSDPTLTQEPETGPGIGEDGSSGDGAEQNFTDEPLTGDIADAGNGFKVDKSILEKTKAMVAAAAAEGVTLKGSGWRSNASQIELRKAHCGTSEYAIYKMPSNQCRPPTAIPGNSQHEIGLALDLTNAGGRIAKGSPEYNWMVKNAAEYGFYNLPTEAWHWSTTGR